MKKKRLPALITAVSVLLSCLQPVCAMADTGDGKSLTETCEQCMEHYEDFLDSPSGYDYLADKENFTYERYKDSMEDTAGWILFLKDICDFSMGTNPDLEECMDALTMLLEMQSAGMTDSLAAQSAYQVEKEFGEYVTDGVKVAASAVCAPEVKKDLEGIKASLGISGDLLSWSMDTKENIEAFYGLTCRYEYQKLFLTAIRDHTENKNLKKAAEALLEMAQCQLAYYLEQAKTDAKLLVSVIKDAAPVFTEEMISWLKSLGTVKSLGAALGGSSKFFGYASSCVSKAAKLFGSVMLAKDIGAFLGDLAVGNVYRYGNEAELMSDISRALLAALREQDPRQKSSPEEQYETLTDTVSLLSALCVTRARGEYCIYGMLINESVPFVQKEHSEEELRSFYDTSVHLIQQTYDLVQTILLTEDFSVKIVCDPQTEDIRGNSGKVVCTSRTATPVVDFPGDPGAIEAINRSLADQADRMRESSSDLFDPDQDMDGYFRIGPNGYGHYYLPGSRMDETVISIRTMETYYYSGAAHPISGWSCMNYDTATGDQLTLSDILTSDNVYGQVVELAARNLTNEDQYGDSAEQISENVTEVLLNYPPSGNDPWNVWYFTSEGLCFVFAPYVVSAYAVGFIVCEIPYEELSGLVQEKYLDPAPRSAGGVGMVATADPAEISSSREVLRADGPDAASGKALSLYGNGGSLYNVTVYETAESSSENYISGDLPIASVSILREGEYLSITCGPSGSVPNLYVVWTDGSGQEHASAYGWTSDGEIVERYVE